MIEHQHGKYLHRRDDALIARVLLIKERQFDMTDEIECPTCDGEGEIEAPFQNQCVSIVAECPPDPVMVDCEDCDGKGWRPMTGDELDAAAERPAENAASEPPVTMDEQHRAAWAQKMELRR